jgi:hypothetical protein
MGPEATFGRSPARNAVPVLHVCDPDSEVAFAPMTFLFKIMLPTTHFDENHVILPIHTPLRDGLFPVLMIDISGDSTEFTQLTTIPARGTSQSAQHAHRKGCLASGQFYGLHRQPAFSEGH